jgi:hypothetical protein
MAENRSHEHEHRVHEHHVDVGQPTEPRFQQSDVNAWAVGKFAIALLLLSIISLAGMFALFRYFISSSGGPLPSFVAKTEIDARKQPPAPQLEVTEPLDLARQRAAEDRLLTTYGWVDRENGLVRIPIERAMDLVAQQGLPYRQQAPAPASTATVPTMSALGTIMQQPGGPLAAQPAGSAAANSTPKAAAPSPTKNPGGPSTQAPKASETQRTSGEGEKKQ